MEKDSIALDSIQKLSDRNILAKYVYVINFALLNKNSYATPYLALTEAPEANPKYLDSIYNNLSQDVAESKYGKALKKFLEKND